MTSKVNQLLLLSLVRRRYRPHVWRLDVRLQQSGSSQFFSDTMFGTVYRRCYSTARRSVLVLTDGKLESTLSGMALGRRMGDMRLKTIVGSKSSALV